MGTRADSGDQSENEHQGKAERIIPLFPELRPYLEAAWDEAPEGAEFVITRYCDTDANLRTQLLRIIRQVGLEPWPKLFQIRRNMRETEFTETFPLHVVYEWIGNTQPIAAKQYLQVTGEHFRKAMRNPMQQPAVSPRTASQSELSAHEKTPVLQGCATECE